ncbi:MAG: cupredoxin domain-containing protein [Actinomycetota bacterium]|nr:cupredoxin domain-containing protein [Actinomycetota bacterium]
MLTESSKIFLPISAVGFVFAFLYVMATGDEAGFTILITLSAAAAFAGVVLAGARQNEFAPALAPDAPPPQWREVTRSQPVRGGGWPVLGAIAAGLVAVGLVTPTVVSMAGVVLGAATVVGWMASVTSARTGRAVNLLPLGIPVVGLFTIFSLMFFMSRVLLAVPESASTLIALLVAIAILGGASIIALRPGISSRAIMGVLGAAGLLLLAGGLVAAVAGNREIEHHGAAHEPVEMVAQGTAFKEKEIHLTADTPALIHFKNDDPAPHNVAIYTDETAQQDIFIGGVIIGPNKSIEYDFRAPPPGEYFFRCDVHPNMAGKVAVTA